MPLRKDTIYSLNSNSLPCHISPLAMCVAFGLLCALELVQERAAKTPFPADGPEMTRLLDILAEEGVLTRADSNVYLAPPLCIQRHEVDRLVVIVDTALSRFEHECGYL